MLKSIILTLLIASSQLIAKNYKGAELYSTSPVLYGKFEMCIQSAKANGMLSTFFLYKDGSEIQGTFWEEIDIEIFGKNNGQSFQSNIITGTGPRTLSEQVHSFSTSLADQPHIYGLEWTPDYVAWYLDGQLLRKTIGGQVKDLKSPMSYRFNLWASNSVPWVGTFDPSNLPKHQYVDWLTYSEYTPGIGNDFTYKWKDDFSSLDNSRWGTANWTFSENLMDFEPNNINFSNGKLVLSATTSSSTGYNGITPAAACSTPLGTDKYLDLLDEDFKLTNHQNAYFEFQPSSANLELTVYNSDGKYVLNHTGNFVFGETFKPGLYLCLIKGNNRQYIRKVLKN